MDLFLDSDARMLVRDFVKLRADETLTILVDGPRRHEGEALVRAAQEIGVKAVSIDMSQEVAALLLSDAFWTPPPPSIVAAVQASNVTIAVIDETYGFRLDHKVRGLFETGPECSLYKVDLGMGSWRLTPADIAQVSSIADRLLGALASADRIHVTSPGGTDVTLSIKGHGCLPVVAVPERGLPYAIPIPLWGEYNWAPVAGSVNGTIVIDGITEATAVLHVVSEPVTWTILEDRIVDVRGGQDADDFQTLFAIDDGASLIGELGVGGNPRAIYGTETEKARFGTVHFGVGQNDEYPGGEVRSTVHVDGVVRNARLEADGRVLVADGRLMVD